MTEIETIEQAQNYAQEIENYRNYSEIDSMKVASSLSTLAKSQNKETFKRVIDSFTRLAREIQSNSDLDNKLKENPLSYLEFLCVFADGNQNYYHPYRPITAEKPPVGETQAYFNKLCGEHF